MHKLAVAHGTSDEKNTMLWLAVCSYLRMKRFPCGNNLRGAATRRYLRNKVFIKDGRYFLYNGVAIRIDVMFDLFHAIQAGRRTTPRF